jgi:hypothetical protein
MLVLAVFLMVGAPLVAASGVWQEGTVGGDKLVMGGDYFLRSDQTLGGNLAVLGGSAMLEPGSTVNGDVVVLGGNLTVAGAIRGGLTVFGGNVHLRDAAIVEGDLASFGGSVQRDPGAIIEGETLDRMRPLLRGNRPFVLPGAVPFDEGPSPFGSFFGWQLGTFGFGLLSALLGVFLVLVIPRHMGRVVNTAATQPAFSFGVGLLTVVLAVVAGALLLIACGLGLIVLLILMAGMFMGWAAAGLWLGERLLGGLRLRSTSAVAEVAVGTFLLTVLARLPLCIGFLVGLVVGSIGLGAVVLTRFGTRSPDAMAPARYTPPPLPPHPALPGDTQPVTTASSTPPAGEPPMPDAPSERPDMS